MNVGIVCYASVGGSGVVASELARCLADRGHSHARDQQRHAVPPARVGFRRQVPPRRDARLSAVSRAAIPAGAGQPHRAGGARASARHHPRALRDSTRGGGVSGAADSRQRRRRGSDCAAHDHDAPRHRCHDPGLGSVVPRNGGVLHRSVRCGHRGVSKPARRHQARDAGQKRHRRHSELPGLRLSSPRAGSGVARSGFARPTRSW